MPSQIPHDFIDDLLSRTDIVEVIERRVPLKKAGREYSAHCPFHEERTPSFTVSPVKQFYHCFGCGAHGNAISFLMDYERLSFPEAVAALADEAGLALPNRAPGGDDAEGPALYDLLERAAAFYQQQLRRHRPAIDYLKQRGLTGETAAMFRLGYAPDQWDSLKQALGAPEAELLAAGLLSRSENNPKRTYDRFRGRIMFPIRDRRGRTVGFGARALGDGAPKYLNSPETAVFHKGRELYGLWEARQANRRLPMLLAVEGYMDVIMLAQHGLSYAVATLGTSTTGDHIRQMFRLAPEIVFCFDGDRAGHEAAWRALEQTVGEMRQGRQARFLLLPEGHDPDSLVRKEGVQAFEQRLDQALTLSEFLVKKLHEQADMKSTEGRARFLELAQPYFQRVPPGPYRLLLGEQLAREARVESEKLSMLMGARAQGVAKTGVTAPGRVRLTLVRRLVALLLQRPALALSVDSVAPLRGLTIEGANLLADIIELGQQRPHLTTGSLLEYWRDHEYGPHLQRLAQMSFDLPEQGIESEFTAGIAHLLKRHREASLERLLKKAEQTALTEAEKRELNQLLSQRSKDM